MRWCCTAQLPPEYAVPAMIVLLVLMIGVAYALAPKPKPPEKK